MAIVDSDAPVASLTPGKVLAALRIQYERRFGNAANKDRKNLVAAWNWGMKYLGMPGPNPCLVEKFPEERDPRYIPPEADFWKVFQQTQGQGRVLLPAYLHLGARCSELFRLFWEDVDFGARRICHGTREREGGSLEYDWLPMTGELFEALRWWREHRTFPRYTHVFVCEQEDGFCAEQYGTLFKEQMHFMRTLCERARGRPFGFHAIRHLTASVLYRLGQPVRDPGYLRHKSPNTTALYLKSLCLEETRGALESLSARHAGVTHSFRQR